MKQRTRAPLQRPEPGYKCYLEIPDKSDTISLIAPSLRKKNEGHLPYVPVMCDDSQMRQLLDAGWTLIEKLDCIALGDDRYGTEFKDKLDFVIWMRKENKRTNGIATAVRKHGIYREEELLADPKQSCAKPPFFRPHRA